MYEILLHIYTNYNYLGYPIITLFSLFEGPIVTVMLGSIIKFGYFNLFLVYIAVMLGDMIGDISLYYIGYKHGDKALQKVRSKFDIQESQVEKVKMLFHKNKYFVLFVSKVTNGFGFSLVVLLTAGIIRIPFALYFLVNLIAQLIWSGALLFLGYHFIGIYQKIDTVIGKTSYVALVIALGIALYIWKRTRKNN